MADIRSRALAYLRDGNVRISYALTAGDSRTPHEVLAYVDGHHSTYLVRLTNRAWGCSCREEGCAHVAAVALVTGHPSAALRPSATAIPAGAVSA